jgi:hypothetical protein
MLGRAVQALASLVVALVFLAGLRPEDPTDDVAVALRARIEVKAVGACPAEVVWVSENASTAAATDQLPSLIVLIPGAPGVGLLYSQFLQRTIRTLEAQSPSGEKFTGAITTWAGGADPRVPMPSVSMYKQNHTPHR